MANAPPERQWLLHKIFVTYNRNHYVRCHASHITGTMCILCRNVDLARIMLQYKDVASYHVMCVVDTNTGKEYPEMRTKIMYNRED